MLELFIQNNIYSLIVAIVSLSGAYFVIQYKLTVTTEKFGDLNVAVIAMKKRITDLETKQNDIGKIQTNLEWLIRAVEDIKKKLNIL